MAFSTSSLREPIISVCPHEQIQYGSGVPQYLERDIAQSFKFSSQLPKRFSPTYDGYQLTVYY